jgi:hypothetical protein
VKTEETETPLEAVSDTPVANDELTAEEKAGVEELIRNLPDPTVEVSLNSLEARIGYASLLRQMQHAYLRHVAYFRSPAGGSLPLEEAQARAYHPCRDEAEARAEISRLMSYPLDLVNFVDLLPLLDSAPEMAERFWELMKKQGRAEFETGHLASKSLAPVDYMKTAWQVASYLGLRESFIREWKPHGGLELSLIDTMAQAFLQFQYWVRESIVRSQTEPRREAYEYTEWKNWKRAERKAQGWGPGHWDVPYQREADAQNQAAQMADRWNRIYLRALRNLRDFRRYAPVTINNPQQVNIAADGGRQLNVQTETKTEPRNP